MAAFLLGLVQFVLPKGTGLHRVMGWLWVGLMAGIALSSFFIHTICQVGGFSLIHLLSILTLAQLPFALRHARQGRIAEHRRAMQILFFAALLIAGGFTLLPGRIMHDVVFATGLAHGACQP